MTVSASDQIPAVGLRQPCPCGSGRRYKACHGKADARRSTFAERVDRPFRGLPGEPDWVAMREVVPAASATVRLTADPERRVDVVTVLPYAAPALVRADGSILLALQVAAGSGNPGRDVAAALTAALEAPAGIVPSAPEGEAPALTDLLDVKAPFEVTVHDSFDFWAAGEDDDPTIAAAAERAASSLIPTVRLGSVEAAYWCRVGGRTHLRWAMPYDEEPLLDGLARLHAAGETRLVPDSRFIGSFRAGGLLVPVWDLPSGTEASAVEEPAAAFGKRVEVAVADTAKLSSKERGARAGLLNRQLTLR